MAIWPLRQATPPAPASGKPWLAPPRAGVGDPQIFCGKAPCGLMCGINSADSHDFPISRIHSMQQNSMPLVNFVVNLYKIYKS